MKEGYEFDFSGHTLVLTGAAGGIGRETARIFGRGGANMVLADVDISASLDWKSLGLKEEQVLLVDHDAASLGSNERLITTATERFGGIDHLVPCAGIYRDHPLSQMSPADWRETVSVNLDGVFWLVKAAWGELNEGASVVLLTSVSAHRGSAMHAHYTAAKAGVLGLARSLVLEAADRSVRVNAVAPGVIATDMTAGLFRRRGAELARETPLGRNGRAEEVASVIAFLGSRAATFVNGATLHVNGGLYMT